MKKRRIVSLVLALAMMLSLSAFGAEKQQVYVAFGDSIASGYGLRDYDAATDTSNIDYVSMLTGDAQLIDYAVSGMESGQLLELVQQETVVADVQKADLITVSIGGNDLLHPLLQAVMPDVDVAALLLGDSAAAVTAKLGDMSVILPAIMSVIGSVDAITQQVYANVSATLAAIKAANPDAAVVIQTVYNPYRGSQLLQGYDSMLDTVFEKLNTQINAAANENGAIVADVFAAFKPYGSAVLNSSKQELFYDPHPNYNGHVVIAETIEAALTDAGIALFDGVEALASDLYSDVDAGSKYLEAVKTVSDLALMNGVGDGKFGPDENLNRAMVVTVLSRIAPVESAASAEFIDVEPGMWYEAAVNWGAATGVVTGYDDGTFRPTDPVTREQLAVLLYRYFGSPETSGQLAAADADEAGSWAVDALVWVLEKGILELDASGDLDPKGYATRGETAYGVAVAVAAVK